MDPYSGLELMFVICVIIFVIGLFSLVYIFMRFIYKHTRGYFKYDNKKRGKKDE